MSRRQIITSSISIVLLLIGILLILSGCNALSSSDETGLESRTFKAEVEGYVNQSFEGGEALFETERSDKGDSFSLVLQHIDADTNYHRIVFSKFSEPLLPDSGTYPLVNNEELENQEIPTKHKGLYYTNIVDHYFLSTGGTLTITDSSDDMLKGSFDFPALGPDEVHITGQFYAERGETD